MHAFAAAPIGIVPRVRWLRPLVAFLFLAFGLLLWTEDADARPVQDARLQDARLQDAHLADAERAIGISQPVDPREQEIYPCTAQPAYPAGSLGGLFSRPGMIGGFAAGFLGAGIFGLLFGHGLIGEVSGLPSILGLIFQFALLFALGWLIWGWWRADQAAAVTQLSPRQLADAYGRARNEPLPDVGAEANGKVKTEASFADEAHLPL